MELQKFLKWALIESTDLQLLGCKRSYSAFFANSRANYSDSYGLIKFIIELIRDLMITYILTKFGADWSIFLDMLECKQSQIQQFFQTQGQITPDELILFAP